MSAFVVDITTMDRAVSAICGRNFYGQIVYKFQDIDTQLTDAPTLIGRRLFTLNVEAVMQRYPDTQDNPGDLPGMDGAAALPLTYVHTRSPSRGLVDGYKAIRCLMYQCSEGDADKSEVFRALNDAAGQVAYAIVATMPEYERAAW